MLAEEALLSRCILDKKPNNSVHALIAFAIPSYGTCFERKE